MSSSYQPSYYYSLTRMLALGELKISLKQNNIFRFEIDGCSYETDAHFLEGALEQAAIELPVKVAFQRGVESVHFDNTKDILYPNFGLKDE